MSPSTAHPKSSRNIPDNDGHPNDYDSDFGNAIVEPSDDDIMPEPAADQVAPKIKTKAKKSSKSSSKTALDPSLAGQDELSSSHKDELSAGTKKRSSKKTTDNSAGHLNTKSKQPLHDEDGRAGHGEDDEPSINPVATCEGDENIEPRSRKQKAPETNTRTPKQTTPIRQSGDELVPPSTSDRPASTKKSTQSPLSALMLKKIANASDQSNLFQTMTTVTEDEVEACYPSVSIIANAVRSGCPMMPDKDLLHEYFAEECERQNIDDGNVLTKADSTRLNPERLRDAMLAGAFMDNAEIVDECLKKGADVCMAEGSGRNILHYLATGGHSNLAKKVIKKMEKVAKGETAEIARRRFVDALNKRDKTGWTPLIVAVCRNQLSMADLLLSYPEVDTNIQLSHSCPPSQGSDKTESSAIHFASIQANAQMIKKFMLRQIPMNVKDSMKRTIFHYIGANKNPVQAAACLATMIAEPTFEPRFLREKDAYGRNPLFLAIASGATELATQMMRTLHNAFVKSKACSSTESMDAKSLDSSEAHDTWSLTDEILSQDQWGLAAVQVAHLRRHYEMIYHLGRVWPGFRNAAIDEETFMAALTKKRPSTYDDGTKSNIPLSPSLMLDRVLRDQDFWTDWLKADLNSSELNTLDLIKKALLYIKAANTNRTMRTQLKMSLQEGRQALVKENMLIRAVHRLGRDIMIKSLESLFTFELNNFFTGHLGTLETSNKPYDPESHYFQSLKATLFKTLPEPEAEISWKYVAAAKPAGAATKIMPRTGRQNSHTSHTGLGLRESSSASPETHVPSFAAAILPRRMGVDKLSGSRTSSKTVQSQNRTFASSRAHYTTQTGTFSPDTGFHSQLRSPGVTKSVDRYPDESTDNDEASVVPHFAAPIRGTAITKPGLRAPPINTTAAAFRSMAASTSRTVQTKTTKMVTKRIIKGNQGIDSSSPPTKATYTSTGNPTTDDAEVSEQDFESSSVETKSSMTGLESSSIAAQ